jgi:tRNA threonylcarbamoyladenosine biosynthesis protein TsaE
MEITTHSTEETKDLAKRLAQKAKPGDIYALYGDLGSGKTTFTSFFVAALGFKNRVQSPTFVIVRNYKRDTGEIKQVFHVDLYRLTSEAEVEDIGLDEMMSTADTITIIEWPEIYDKKLPEHTKKMYFEYADKGARKIKYV